MIKIISFINRLKLSPLDNSEKWEVLDMFEIHVKNIRSQNIIIQVPKGFITDGASVPRIFWIYLPRFGKYTKASVVHDYLYNKKGFIYIQENAHGFFKSKITRKEADLIFKKIMKVDKVNKFKYWCIYYSVRLFGRFYWKK